MKTCELCKKHISFGNQIARRGMPKYLGGVGLKTTGVTRRKFHPNVQKVRIDDEGETRVASICTRCIKTGLVKKPRKREIPDEVRKAMRERAEARKPENRRAARKARKVARAAAAKAAPKKPGQDKKPGTDKKK